MLYAMHSIVGVFLSVLAPGVGEGTKTHLGIINLRSILTSERIMNF